MIDHIVMLWYSVKVPYTTMLLLRVALQELISTRAKEHFKKFAILVTDEDIKSLQGVWRKWHEFAKEDTSWIIKSYLNRNLELLYITGMPQYIASIPKDKQKSMLEWSQTGKFGRAAANVEELVFGNVTFAGKTLLHHQYEYQPSDNSIMPFTGWDYKKVVAYHDSSSIIDMFFRYICQTIKNAHENMARRNVTFHIHVCDIINLPRRLPSSIKFDRIHMSNIADYINYTTLLDIFAHSLKAENNCSAIVMELQNWFPNHFRAVIQETEGSFGSKTNELRRKMRQGLKITIGQEAGMQMNHRRDFNEAIDENFPLYLQCARLAGEKDFANADADNSTRKFKSGKKSKFSKLITNDNDFSSETP